VCVFAPSLRGAEATKQSIHHPRCAMDCFAGARNDGFETFMAMGPCVRDGFESSSCRCLKFECEAHALAALNLTPSSSPRTRGPITTGVGGCTKSSNSFSHTNDTAYGSPRSRGRHGELFHLRSGLAGTTAELYLHIRRAPHASPPPTQDMEPPSGQAATMG
jgi:hypothetical protein